MLVCVGGRQLKHWSEGGYSNLFTKKARNFKSVEYVYQNIPNEMEGEMNFIYIYIYCMVGGMDNATCHLKNKHTEIK